MANLLTSNNAKIEKSLKLGYLTVGIHLAPAKLSGFNTCPMASAGCAAACLNTSGMGAFSTVQNARIAKTKEFFENRDGFMAQLVKEIAAAVKKAAKKGLTLAVRLNLTSDIQWETIRFDGKTVFEHFPTVQFYDYTKIVKRVLPGSLASEYSNYHLTFSRSESNDAFVTLAMEAGANVAMVFDKLPEVWQGRQVINGDDTDLRFLDPQGCIVGLVPKGKAKKDASGFVVQTEGRN